MEHYNQERAIEEKKLILMHLYVDTSITYSYIFIVISIIAESVFFFFFQVQK